MPGRRRVDTPRTGAELTATLKQKRAFARDLLAWYRLHKRDLPWRSSRDPYAIWVSEAMLQQTQVATVVDYYARWMKRFPTLKALAKANEDDVLHCWQGLGYYSRARRLLAGARQVVAEYSGVLPTDIARLRQLPGIGPYSAGAIASIAFNQPAPIVDGNVVRVMTRVFALRGDPTKAPLKGIIWKYAELLIPRGHAGDFNQAMMELGATVCSPRAPSCKSCPVAGSCQANHLGLVEKLPELPQRAKPTAERHVAAFVQRRGRVLLVKARPQAPRWASMWQFPNAPLDGRRSASPKRRQDGAESSPDSTLIALLHRETGLRGRVAERLLTVRHTVTRFRIALDVYAATVSGKVSASLAHSVGWHRPEELHELAMPAAHRRIAQALLSPETDTR